MTPHTVHYGQAEQLTAKRNTTLEAAFAAHPNRFKGLVPKPPVVPTAAWINPPKEEITSPEIIVANSLNSSRQVSQCH